MSQQSYTYCTITSNTPIGKKYDADLNKLDSPNNVFSGTAEVYEGTIEEIAADIEAFNEHQCLTVGVPPVDSCHLTTKGKEKPGEFRNGLPVLARSKANWQWPKEPGLLVFDHDPDHWTDAPLTSIEMVIDGINQSLGVDLADHDYIARPSSSSMVYDGEGNQVVGFKGVHIYVGVTDLSVLRGGRGEELLDLAAQRGLGCMVLSKSSSFLKRGVFDSSLHKAPNAIVFCAPAQFEGEHESRREVTVNCGIPLDLKAVLGTLDAGKADSEWQSLKAGMAGEQTRVFESYVGTMELEGIPREVTEAAVNGGSLSGVWPIVFDDGTVVPLWRIMTSAADYNGRDDVRDPLEPDYGPSKAKLYVDAGTVTINSFAHGQRVFTSHFDMESWTAALEGSDGDEVKKHWPKWATHLTGVKAPEAARALRHLDGDLGKQGELSDRLTRILKASARRRVRDSGERWAKWGFLTGSNAMIDIEALDKYRRVHMVKPQAFNIINCTSRGPGGEAPIEWLVGAMKAIPMYSHIQYSPPDGLFDPLPVLGDALNGWRGGPAFSPSVAEPAMWMKLVMQLVPDEEQRENLLDWLAYSLQYPGRKCNWQMLLRSEEGRGKDSMLAPLRWGMGQHNCVDITTTELLSDFNSYLIGGPSLLVVQEMDASKKGEMRTKLKPLAAAPPAQHTVNQKNEKPVFVDNTQSVMVLTNERHPFPLDSGDRRWYLIECAFEALPPAFFKQLWAGYSSGGYEQVCGWLASRDLSAFDADVLPGTTAYKEEVIEQSRTGYHMVIEEYLEENDGIRAITASLLAGLVKEHSGENVTHKNITKTLGELGWANRKGQKSISGKQKQTRGWVRPGVAIDDVELFNLLNPSLRLESVKK